MFLAKITGTPLVILRERGSNTKLPKFTFREASSEALGIARITLLRARAAGRIRFFRIGTRVLYSETQLVEFLDACEQNGRVAKCSSSESSAVRSQRRQTSHLIRARRPIKSRYRFQ